MFSRQQLRVVNFCALQVTRQGDDPDTVYDMVRAWDYADDQNKAGTRAPGLQQLMVLAHLVKPDKNDYYLHMDQKVNWRRRQVYFYFGETQTVCAPWQEIPRLMDQLTEKGPNLTTHDYYQELMRIHPWEDGNGRVGDIVWNWMHGSLDYPESAPAYVGTRR